MAAQPASQREQIPRGNDVNRVDHTKPQAREGVCRGQIPRVESIRRSQDAGRLIMKRQKWIRLVEADVMCRPRKHSGRMCRQQTCMAMLTSIPGDILLSCLRQSCVRLSVRRHWRVQLRLPCMVRRGNGRHGITASYAICQGIIRVCYYVCERYHNFQVPFQVKSLSCLIVYVSLFRYYIW